MKKAGKRLRNSGRSKLKLQFNTVLSEAAEFCVGLNDYLSTAGRALITAIKTHRLAYFYPNANCIRSASFLGGCTSRRGEDFRRGHSAAARNKPLAVTALKFIFRVVDLAFSCSKFAKATFVLQVRHAVGL